MIKLDYIKLVAKFDELEENFGRNTLISPDIIKKKELVKYYKKLKSMGFDVPNNHFHFLNEIVCYVNNIISIDFTRKEVFFSVGIYYKL